MWENHKKKTAENRKFDLEALYNRKCQHEQDFTHQEMVVLIL